MVFCTKKLHKSKQRTIDVYLKLIDSLVNPIILYACECWRYSLKKDCFANKIEKFYMSIYKQLLEVKIIKYESFSRTRKNAFEN